MFVRTGNDIAYNIDMKTDASMNTRIQGFWFTDPD